MIWSVPDEGDPIRQPTSDVGVYLHKHEHEWVEIGAERWENGVWHPVFECAVCTDVICDLFVDAMVPIG